MSSVLAASISGDRWVESTFAGLAVGSKYALVALGFVIVFKATGIINFAQSGFVLIGGYLAFNAVATWGWDFYLALPTAMIGGALLGMAIEWLVLRRMIGEAPFTLIMVTIGVLFVLNQVVTAVWGPAGRGVGDPWGTRTVNRGEIGLRVADLWALGLTAVVLGAFFVFFRYSTLGLAMRATAADQEAAMAQGIAARRVYRAAWAIAGSVGALAGVVLASGVGQLEPRLGLVALVAFPAMILGGLESPLGAVVGGLVMGLVEQLTALLAPVHAAWLGESFERVSPYLVMIVILLIRPYGLFGTREVRRV
ncbi:MAG: branched-chain amino acid ABC transporter permease [Acidimicrobiales bacterium]